MKIVFFGTANVALPILEELNIDHKVLAVVTNPDAPVGRSRALRESAVSALAKDLQLVTLKPQKVRGNQEFLNQLSDLKADIFVVVAYGSILPPEIINLPPLKTINVHFSALPKYRGPSPIQAALRNGDEQTGSSIFILDEQVDHGPLLAQKIVNIEPDDNYLTLSLRLAKVSAHLLLETLADYQAGRITPLPQDEEGASYSKIINKSDGRIDWQKSAQEIYNQFRAFYPWPGIWTQWDGKKLKITDCLPAAVAGDNQPATVLAGGLVACGHQTALQIRQLQLEGKTESPITDFLNGYQNFINSRLV